MYTLLPLLREFVFHVPYVLSIAYQVSDIHDTKLDFIHQL